MAPSRSIELMRGLDVRVRGRSTHNFLSGMPNGDRERRNRLLRVSKLFEEILDAQDPEAVLAREKNEAVRMEVRELWASHTSAGQAEFLARPVEILAPPGETEPLQFSIGQVLNGRFAIQELLGTGGMGEVYRASDGELGGTVALKTIRLSLAAKSDVRRRFIAEIQNARRVTHPNVCRINDLFNESGIPFFSMQCLDGQSLADWLAPGLLTAGVRRKIAIQLADALKAAHRFGVLHCDFKPTNIILVGQAPNLQAIITDFGLARAVSSPEAPLNAKAAGSLQAGTFSYMAPELLEGAPPSVATDIFSFGVVLSELLPKSAIAARCSSVDPKRRPASMSQVLDVLQRKTTRRVAVGTIIVAPMTAAAFIRWNGPKPLHLPRRKVAVATFRPDDLRQSSMLRDLLVMALQQSPIFSVLPDEQLRSILHSAGQKAAAVLDPAGLRQVATEAEIALVLEGVVSESRNGMGLSIRAFESGQQTALTDVAEHVADPGRLALLADRAALRLRQNLGESESSLRALHTPLEQVTSASPEAVDLYYRGVERYESAHVEEAETLLEEAIRIDPRFALAHLRLGMARASGPEVANCVECYERAFQLSNRVGLREKLWIESRYYNIIGDFETALDRCSQLVTHFPDEATFHRHRAFAYARLGRAADGLADNQQAVDQDPANIHNRSEWIVNLGDANQPGRALALYDRFRSEGPIAPLLGWGAGLAHMALGNLDAALSDFEFFGTQPELDRWARLERCGPLVLAGRFAEAQAALTSDLAYDDARPYSDHRDIRRYWLGRVSLLCDDLSTARECAVGLAKLTPTPVFLDELRQGALLAGDAGDPESMATILDRLRDVERRWPSTRASGIRRHIESQFIAQKDAPLSRKLLNEASGLWPDPLTLLSVAEELKAAGDSGGEMKALLAIEAQQGRILNGYFPGLLIQARIQRARCLARMSRIEESRRLYSGVLKQWLPNASGYSIVSDLKSEYRRLLT